MFGQFGSGSPTEPMMLGSPGSSPGSTISGGESQFLPGYLTGATTPSTPQGTTKPWFVGSSQGILSVQQHMTGIHDDRLSPYSKTPRNVPEQRSRDKPGVPPVQGLFDKMPSPVVSSSFRYSTAQDNLHVMGAVGSSLSQTDNISGILTPSKNLNRLSDKLYASPAQVDPFYTQGESLTASSQLDETWVTVFGFPPTAAAYILQEFSHCGTILEHKVAPNGNWMHIHYETKLQAKKAIGKNGKIFADSIMIGITQCIDKNVMSESSKENTVLSPNLSTSVGESSPALTNRGLRPLTQAYKTAVSSHKVTPQSRTPQKSTSVVSKAMEYLLNW